MIVAAYTPATATLFRGDVETLIQAFERLDGRRISPAMDHEVARIAFSLADFAFGGLIVITKDRYDGVTITAHGRPALAALQYVVAKYEARR